MLQRRDFQALRIKLASEGPKTLAKLWPSFDTMQKVVFFKLLEPDAAIELFNALPSAERYRLLGSLEPGAVAPLIEDRPAPVKALFRRLPEEAAAELHRLAFAPPPR